MGTLLRTCAAAAHQVLGHYFFFFETILPAKAAVRPLSS